ncbi:MAG: hypothetical protein JO128_01060 [Alphaproteobacteria bacterium]|nr:hypothetical protein [Alphaproteobacteria bacterium]
MTDYWLSKLFFDLQNPVNAAEYRAGRAEVLARYPELKPELRTAALADDVAALAPHVNPYLLRYYFQVVGMPDKEFIGRLRALKPEASGSQALKTGAAHG